MVQKGVVECQEEDQVVPPGGGGGDPDGGYSGGQAPRFGTFGQDARPLAVGALRLEAPPRYQGGTRPGVRAWLREMGRWMRLMDYPQAKWIDIVATRTEGAAQSWLTHEQQVMERRTRVPWADWDEFAQEMIRAFEPTTDESRARQQLSRAQTDKGVSLDISRDSEKFGGASRT